MRQKSVMMLRKKKILHQMNTLINQMFSLLCTLFGFGD